MVKWFNFKILMFKKNKIIPRLCSRQAPRLRSGQAFRLCSRQAPRLRSGQAFRLRSRQAFRFLSRQAFRLCSRQAGFTIIELLVSIGIFLSLFLIVTVNFRAGEYTNALRLEVQKIASDIRKVQTATMTGSTYNGQPIGAGGYGLYFSEATAESISYLIFKDVNANGVYDGALTDIVLETKNLASDFNQLSFIPVGVSIIHMVFQPYSSNISVKDQNSADISSSEVSLRLLHSKVTNKTGVVSITPVSGKVDFVLESL